MRSAAILLMTLLLNGMMMGADSAEAIKGLKDGRLSKVNLKYVGAFKVPVGTKGETKDSHFGYSEGLIAFDPERNSFYISGHRYVKGIAEVTNPGLIDTDDMSKLPRANYVQPFRNLLDNTSGGNPDGLDEIGGLYIEKGRLLFTGYEYYDANTSVKAVFGILKQPGNMAQSEIGGYYETGHGAHTAGWVSPIPPEYQKALKGTHIMASGQSQSIAGRYPLRPAAFSFNGADVFGEKIIEKTLNVTALIDGDLSHELPREMWDKSLDEAHYAIIVPGTKTYIAFGYRGGMHSKIGYKITTDDGRLTGGYSAQDDDDHYMYYWMYNVDDMIRAAGGKIKPHEVIPYEHGKLALPFIDPNHSSVGGGTWDPKTKTVYLTLNGRDQASLYTTLPIVAAIRFEAYDGKDSIAPYGAMTEPNDGKKVKGKIPLEAHAIDNVDKENDLSVQFMVNGQEYEKPATTFPFRVTLDTEKLKNGSCSISAVAADRAGNKRILNTVKVDVENQE